MVRFHGDAERASNVYKNIKPLTPADVAEVIVWAADRPAHVNIARVLLTPVQQANSLLFHRDALSGGVNPAAGARPLPAGQSIASTRTTECPMPEALGSCSVLATLSA